MSDLVPVRVRDCACPGQPHDDGDVVYLAPKLDIDGGVDAETDLIESAGNQRDLTKRWMKTFVRHGARGWNLVDADGEPVPFDIEVILSDWALARIVGDAGSDLYAEAVIAPFQKAPAQRSPTGRTVPTTSRTRRQPTTSAA